MSRIDEARGVTPGYHISGLSRAAQMRRKFAEGYTVGEVARFFGTNYYVAYSACVVNAAAGDRVASGRGTDQFAPEVLSALSWNEILTVTQGGRGKTKAQKKRWYEYRQEEFRRDPSPMGDESERQIKRWLAEGKPPR